MHMACMDALCGPMHGRVTRTFLTTLSSVRIATTAPQTAAHMPQSAPPEPEGAGPRGHASMHVSLRVSLTASTGARERYHPTRHAGTSPEHAQHIHRSMKLPIIGGMTQGEGEALGAFTTSGGTCEAVQAADLSIHGVMLDNGPSPAYTSRTACPACPAPGKPAVTRMLNMAPPEEAAGGQARRRSGASGPEMMKHQRIQRMDMPSAEAT